MNDPDKTVPPPDDHGPDTGHSDDDPVSENETFSPDSEFTTETSEKSMPEISEQFGRYHIRKLLGKGAMGSVYLARDDQLDRMIALKVPKVNLKKGSKELARFYREAQSAGTLRHANICPVYDVGEIDGLHFISMAFIEGRPLSEYINTGRKISQSKAASVIRKLAQALETAHKQGIIHRDLKPENILIDRSGEPIITDFGIAHRYQEQNARLTQSGALLGSPAYMSPEQIEGEVDRIGPESDIYSLGVLFYELLAGRLPFEGTTAAVLGQIIAKDAPPLSRFREDVLPDLESICLTMIQKEPGDRYSSMQDVAQAIEDFFNESSLNEPARKNQPVQVSPDSDTATDESAITPPELEQAFLPPETKEKSVKMSQLPSWLITGGIILGLLIAGLAVAVVSLFVRMNGGDEGQSRVPALVQSSLDENNYRFWIDGKPVPNMDEIPKLKAGSHTITLKDADGKTIDETTMTVDSAETEGIVPYLNLSLVDGGLKIVVEKDYASTKRGLLELLLGLGVKVKIQGEDQSETMTVLSVDDLPDGRFEVLGFDLSEVQDLNQVHPEQIEKMFPEAEILTAED